ncbi:hypothetical protein E2C01_102045 [Portunus trituberculatus]|nr:hypothetical protein [Portunus trituberculatus]
MLRGQD